MVFTSVQSGHESDRENVVENKSVFEEGESADRRSAVHCNKRCPEDCDGVRRSRLVRVLWIRSIVKCYNLYLERWEIENSIDEVKTHQVEATTVNRPVIFRSKSPERVLQEAHGLIIAYNLIHALIAEGAERAGVEPVRISFVSALARVREAIPRMASAPTRQLPYLYKTLIKRISEAILPARRARSNPRVVKVKMSAYKLKRSDHAA